MAMQFECVGWLKWGGANYYRGVLLSISLLFLSGGVM